MRAMWHANDAMDHGQFVKLSVHEMVKQGIEHFTLNF